MRAVAGAEGVECACVCTRVHTRACARVREGGGMWLPPPLTARILFYMRAGAGYL